MVEEEVNVHVQEKVKKYVQVVVNQRDKHVEDVQDKSRFIKHLFN